MRILFEVKLPSLVVTHRQHYVEGRLKPFAGAEETSSVEDGNVGKNVPNSVFGTRTEV